MSAWRNLAFPFRSASLESAAPEKPRSFPTTGFKLIDPSVKVEEEELPDYVAERFYPVRLGEVIQDQYQTVAKLGFGSSSTIWLARDLKNHHYVSLKFYVHTSRFHREHGLHREMATMLRKTANPGRNNIRELLDSFEIDGPCGKHVVLAFQPAQMSLRDMKLIFQKDGGFNETFVKGAVQELLKALDLLHDEAHIVHTDVHPGNLLLGLNDDSALRPLEEQQFSSPVSRKKVADNRVIYLSQLIRPKPGPMLLSDLGEARSGPGPHAGDIMPIQYRAPEVIMCLKWSYAVDIWSVGLTAWDLLGPKHLFTAEDEDGDMYDAAHLAEFIATIGPPPLDFLKRNPERAADFWDEQGNWLGLAPIPMNRTLERLEDRLEDNSRFLSFLRRVLTWVPEKRPTARELLQDPWFRSD
ncbi:hypothetical protein NLU13_0174 [Sarocladium strictum]|uniref:non-specific serine/threonine protein kinase n=1 Tax=Sarocladium strictum TaxID=5046 RepID=A0AA39GNK0_SARSR|nr:hypothetical protein NLU13_0174 [Sarocladium strictum]